MKKRILGLVLALSMMISLFPVSALAQTPGGGTAEMAEERDTDGYITTLEMKADGTPVTDGRKPIIAGDIPTTIGYEGDGWQYRNGGYLPPTLTLTSGEWDFTHTKPADSSSSALDSVTCEVSIDNGATVKGGKFTTRVYNAGTIQGGTYTGIVYNWGTVNGGTFENEFKNTGRTVTVDGTDKTVYGTINGGLFTGGASGEKTITNEDDASITGGIFTAKHISYTNGRTAGHVTGGLFRMAPSGAADEVCFSINAYDNEGKTYISNDNAGKIKIKTAAILDYIDFGRRAWAVLTKGSNGEVINPLQITVRLYDKSGNAVDINNINGKPIGVNNCNSSYTNGSSDKTTVTFTMPASDVELNKPFNLNVSGGKITVDWNLRYNKEAKIPENTEVTVTADGWNDRTFKAWTVAEDTTTPTDFVDDCNLTTNPTKFTMPAGDVTLTATYYDPALEMDSTGKPKTTNREMDNEGNYIGTNWKYNADGEGTLTLTGGTWDFTHIDPSSTGSAGSYGATKCDIVIEEGATITDGTFSGMVWNNAGGTISGGIFQKTVSNTGKITGGMFTGTDTSNTSVLNNAGGEITGGVFALKPSGEGTISNGYTLKMEPGETDTNIVFETSYYQKIECTSVYVVPSDTYKPKIWVLKRDASTYEDLYNNWSVTINDGAQIAMWKWDGASGYYSFTLNPGKVENDATVMLHKTKDVYVLTVDGGTITSTTGTIDESAKNGSFEKDTVVTVTASDPESGKYFAGWTLEDGTTLPEGSITSQNGLNDRELMFKMPANEVHLKASYKDYDKTLAFDGKGDVITTDREPDGKGGYQGNGWTLSSEKVLTILKGTKLDLNGATVNRSYTVVIQGDETALSNASITNAVFEGVVMNSGNAEQCYFKGSRLYNVGTISNSTINVDELADGENYVSCLFSKKYSVLSSVRSLTTRNGANTITARLEEAGKYPVTGTMLYFTNTPKLGVSVLDASGTVAAITNVNGDKSYAITKESDDYYTFTAPASGDVILNDAVKYTLTVTNGTIKVGEETKESPATLAEDTVATVTAAAPESGKYFAGWTVSDGVTLKGADDEKIDLTGKTLTFQMPTSNVTLTATYEAYETSLVIVDGKPVTTNREPVYEDGKVVGYKGDGWTYINGTLTLSGTFEFAADANTRIDCSVVVGSGAKLSNVWVVGNNTTVENEGAITNCYFENPGVTVSNNGEISNSIFVKKPGSTGTLSGCLFASNEGLTEGHWTVELNYSDGKTAYAGLQDNPFKMPVNEFYVIADASGKLPTIKLSKNASNGSLPAQVTVTAPDGAQWTQNISGTDSFDLTIKQPKYTLTLVNAELVDMTGTEFTENTTIKIKPKFTDEEFELDCWTSDSDEFDVNTITKNENGTYTLTMPGSELELTANGRKKTYSLTVVNGVIGDENGTQNSGEYAKNAEITLTQKVPENKEFTGWELSGGLEPVSGYELTNTTIKVKMPGHAATATATYKDKVPTTYTLTVDGGYIGDDETKASGEFKAEAQIKVTAKAKTGYHFTKWTVKEGTLSLSEEELKANPLTFEMPNGAVSLKANYEEDTPDPVDPNPTPNPDDQPKTYTVTVKGGTINGKTEVKAEKGTKLTVDVDETEVPEGMTFDVWSIRFPEGVKDTLTGDTSVKLHDPHMSFTMPEADITIEAQYRSSELPGEDDGPSTLGTMATVAVGGAAAGILVWQGVSLGVDSYLQLNLPKGVAVPANRRELVMLLWETAGKPEAALPSLYSDVPAEEIELQKATRWAIDNGLVKPADDSDASRFDPDRYVTKYDVFGAWLKLRKLMK